MRPIIALLTDFGLEDSYVSLMKAVMRGICPEADFIDISHHISRQNVRLAALTLHNSVRYFPTGTIFLAVIDPGVGSERRAIAVQTEHYSFVAPDNGLLGYVLGELGMFKAVTLTQSEYRLEPVSQTFHGRDIFAPAAAYLAAGTALEQMGVFVEDLVELSPPKLEVYNEQLIGEVIHVDHFGNVVTSIGEFIHAGPNTLRLKPRFSQNEQVRYLSADRLVFLRKGLKLKGVHKSYSGVEAGEALLLVESNGYLEIAVNQGSGAERFDLRVGDPVEIEV